MLIVLYILLGLIVSCVTVVLTFDPRDMEDYVWSAMFGMFILIAWPIVLIGFTFIGCLMLTSKLIDRLVLYLNEKNS